MKLITVIFVFFIFTTTSISQSIFKKEQSVSGYQVAEVASLFFTKKKRTVKVSLPKNYDTNKNYPVIYVLDGATLFEMTSQYVNQLSKTVVQDGYDYGFDAIPESIVVGVFHNDRGYETTPNFTKLSDGDETVYLEGSEKLKDFLFIELIPFIDSNFSTSNYNSIVGHSNTAHFVMCLPFQKNNPFKGVLSLSLNGDSKKFKAQIKSSIKQNFKINYFIGYGTKDFGFNELAKDLENTFVSNNLTVKSFNANHTELPSMSLLVGLKSLFKEYRNIDDFKVKSFKDDFTIQNYLNHYKVKNFNLYGINTVMKEDDFYSLLDLSILLKNKKVFNDIINYEQDIRGNIIQNHFLFVYNQLLGDFNKAEILADKMMSSSLKMDGVLLNANLKAYYDFLVFDLKKPKKTILFLEKGMNKFPDKKLVYSYYLAKFLIEKNKKASKSETYLNFCLEHYKENRFFTKKDLNILKMKMTSR